MPPPGTSPVGKADGSPLRYGGMQAASNAAVLPLFTSKAMLTIFPGWWTFRVRSITILAYSCGDAPGGTVARTEDAPLPGRPGESALKCLIIAAGMGKRLSRRAESKPLLEVGGHPLIEWVIDGGFQAGVREFVVVTGYASQKVEDYLSAFAPKKGISVSFVRNDEWERENGLSVYKARHEAGDKFILSMSDHIFDPGILRDLAGQPIRADETILAVDAGVEGNAYVDLEDVTKVRVDDGRISAIGKGIENYNAFDTGLFLGTPALFAALKESQLKGDFTLSGGIRALAAKSKARVMDIGGRFWIDVDDEKAMRKAAGLLKAGAPATAKGRA